MPVALLAIEQVDDDFKLELLVNGEDISMLDTIAIDPDGNLVVYLHIFEVTQEIVLHSLTMSIKICEQNIPLVREDLKNKAVQQNGEYEHTAIRNPQQYLSIGDMPITTGVYDCEIKLIYTPTATEDEEEFPYPVRIRITGNPVTSLTGTVAVVATATAAVSATILGISLAGLKAFAMSRLEPTARGSAVGATVRAVRKKVKKRNCPICSSRIKHDYCYSCNKTFKDVEREYNDKVRALASQGLQLLVSGEVKTMGALCSKLNISDRLGMDVVATLKNAKLVKVRGFASKLMAKAVTTGISSAISAILWITIGGFAILSTWMLVTVLFLALLLPILITKYFQWRAKRQVAVG